MNINLSDNIKKFLLAGIGAVASTVDKSKEIVDDLVKKGELTVEQGKTLNEELKHTIKNNVESVKENVVNAISHDKKESEKIENIVSTMDKMTAEELKKIHDKLTEIEKASGTEINEVDETDK